MSNVVMAVPGVPGVTEVLIDGAAYTVVNGTITVAVKHLPMLLGNGYTLASEAVQEATLAARTPSYGSAVENNEAGSNIVLTNANAMYPWITGTVGPVAGEGLVTWDDTNKRLVIGANGAGTYWVHASGAGVISAAADIEVAIFVNEGESALRNDQNIAAQATYQAFAVGGLLSLAASDYVTMRLSSSVAARTWAMRHAQFSIHRVG
jgi:hypothetical protein